MCKNTPKMQVFQGCHSNRWTCGHKNWHANCSCLAERTIFKSKALSQIVSELWAKIVFRDFCSSFSRKTYLVLQFLEYRDENGLNRMLMILRTNARSGLAISVFSPEKMAPKLATVALKNGFSRFLFFLKFESRISTKRNR